MKNLLFLSFFLVPLFLLSQTTNYLTVVNEVDSILEASRKIGRGGQIDAAMELNAVAREKAAAAFGRVDTVYAKCIFFQGILHQYNMAFAESERTFRGFIDTLQLALGEGSVAYARGLLRWTYTGMQYGMRFWEGERSEASYLEARRIADRHLRVEDPVYVHIVHMGGVFYFHMDQFDKAEMLFREVKDIREKSPGKNHHTYAESLTSLGLVDYNMEKYVEAETYLQEALDAWGEIRGLESQSYVSAANYLAALYLKVGCNEEAEELLWKVRNMLIRTGQTQTDGYKSILFKFTDLYTNTKRYDKAEACYLEIRDYFSRLYSEDHAFARSQYANIGYMYAKARIWKKAPENMFKFYDGLFNQVPKYALKLSSADLVVQSEREYRGLMALAYTHYAPPGACQVPGIRYDIALIFKEMLLDTKLKLRKRIASDSGAIRKYQSYQAYQEQLAKEYARSKELSQDVEWLVRASETLEKELMEATEGYRDSIRRVNWREVQAKLRPGEAAVEFMHYALGDTATVYTALLLRPGDALPFFFPLFEEQTLVRLLPATHDADGIDELYGPTNGSKLYRLVWHPLDSLLQGVSTVYCSSTGLLQRVNLGALPIPSDTRTFDEKRRLVLLGSTRQLVTRNARPKYTEKDAVLFGGIQYDPGDNLSTDQPSNIGIKRRGATVTAGGVEDQALFDDVPFPSDTILRGGNTKPWAPLEATKQEVDSISAALRRHGFQTQEYTGLSASEEVFKQFGRERPSPRILHLATHGYYFPPSSEKRFDPPQIAEQAAFRSAEHPMIRSGIILAGANEIWTSGRPPESREDGILTAFEISQVDLSGTELAVLSACETGLGQVEGIIAIYGLQHAFKIAGVKYLIISLWQVKDHTTGELMSAFYSALLDEQLPVPEAFRSAQSKMRAKYRDSPFAWAGFVLVE